MTDKEIEEMRSLIGSFMFNIRLQTILLQSENDQMYKEISRIKGLMK